MALGKTHVFLDGERTSCRVKECNMGNLVLDALVHTNAKQPDGTKWADVGVALWNGGGIRSSIDKQPNGKIPGGVVPLWPLFNKSPTTSLMNLLLKSICY